MSLALKSRGYQQSLNDYSLFHKKTSSSSVFLVIYVDDILVTGDNSSEIADLKTFLDAEFKIKDLGLLHFFLGIEFLTHPKGIIMSQRKYIAELLDEFDCASATPLITPLELNCKLSHDDGELLSTPSVYRRLIGKLNFLIHTRPDIAFTVQFLSQYLQAPRQPHFDAAVHTLRYLKGTLEMGILLNDSPSFKLQAFCDADWAACPHTRKSVSGFIVFMGQSPISWKSKKQQTVSLSSAEAEYRSMRRVCVELAWLSRLLHELGVEEVTPINLKCDNQASIYIAKNPVYHERTKHIDLDCHFVREKLLEGLISLSHVPTKEQLDDILTKSLTGLQHHSILSKLGIIS